MQTDIADDIMENGSETHSYASNNVVPLYNPSSYSWLNRFRQGGTATRILSEFRSSKQFASFFFTHINLWLPIRQQNKTRPKCSESWHFCFEILFRL